MIALSVIVTLIITMTVGVVDGILPSNSSNNNNNNNMLDAFPPQNHFHRLKKPVLLVHQKKMQ